MSSLIFDAKTRQFRLAATSVPTFFVNNLTTPGLTRVERWLTRLWPCLVWTGGVGCPCLRRWTILDTRLGKLFLHRFLADDWSLDMHDHSAAMISVGLWGSYEEQTPTGVRHWHAPWIRRFPATWVHRLHLLTPHVWTLVWVWPHQRYSGFWHEGRWLSQGQYMPLFAKKRKSC